MFYGVIVYMYYRDDRRHKAAHIHVKYQGNEVVIQIPDGVILEGEIPPAR